MVFESQRILSGHYAGLTVLLYSRRMSNPHNELINLEGSIKQIMQRYQPSHFGLPSPALQLCMIYIAQILAHPSRPPLTMYLSINLSRSAGFVCPLTTMREC